MIVSYSFWGIHLCFSCCYTVFFVLPSTLFLSSLFLWCFPVRSILLVVSRWWMKKTGKWVSRCVYKMYLIWIELLFMPPMLSFDRRRRRRRRRREFFLLLRNLFPLSCSLFDIFLILFFFFFASSLHPPFIFSFMFFVCDWLPFPIFIIKWSMEEGMYSLRKIFSL